MLNYPWHYKCNQTQFLYKNSKIKTNYTKINQRVINEKIKKAHERIADKNKRQKKKLCN
jgi:hypothetical protein